MGTKEARASATPASGRSLRLCDAEADRSPATRSGVVQGERGGQRSTRARCFTNAGVVCLVHTAVAASLTASMTDTGAVAPTWPCPA
jgi:hypothetical protein